MKNKNIIIAALVLSLAALLAGCPGGGGGGSNNIAYYDITTQPIPQFVSTNYVDLANIKKVSLFRSGEGHSYTATGSATNDPFENCRSMKHYFAWTDPNQTGLNVYSPVDGTVDTLKDNNTQVWIRVKDYPAFSIRIFHVVLNPPLKIGDTVTKGQQLGVHDNPNYYIYSDIAVTVNVSPSDPAPRLVSYFDVMTDDLSASYHNRGANSRQDFIISKDQRDAYPLECSSTSDSFITQPVQDLSTGQSTSNSLSNWFIF